MLSSTTPTAGDMQKAGRGQVGRSGTLAESRNAGVADAKELER